MIFFIKNVASYRSRIATERAQLGIPEDAVTILMVAKLTQYKNPDHLLAAYQRLKQQNLHVTLIFVGSGSEEEVLREAVRETELDQVHFMGFQNQSQLPRFYAIADVFAFPAEKEAWGLVINEAMCAGLPIITTEEVGAAPDLVHHGENGFQFSTGDVDALTNHLRTLVTDHDLRRRMGQASLDIIQKWSYEEDVEQLLVAMDTIYQDQ